MFFHFGNNSSKKCANKEYLVILSIGKNEGKWMIGNKLLCFSRIINNFESGRIGDRSIIRLLLSALLIHLKIYIRNSLIIYLFKTYFNDGLLNDFILEWFFLGNPLKLGGVNSKGTCNGQIDECQSM
jgi:hypothetical protein